MDVNSDSASFEQISFAGDIYEELGYELPEDNKKQSYSDYISEHIDEFYESRRSSKYYGFNQTRYDF